MAERVSEHLKFETEFFKLTTLATLGIGGGSFGLLLGDLTLLRFVFAMSGVLAAIVLFINLWRQRRDIRARIATIPEESV